MPHMAMRPLPYAALARCLITDSLQSNQPAKTCRRIFKGKDATSGDQKWFTNNTPMRDIRNNVALLSTEVKLDQLNADLAVIEEGLKRAEAARAGTTIASTRERLEILKDIPHFGDQVIDRVREISDGLTYAGLLNPQDQELNARYSAEVDELWNITLNRALAGTTFSQKLRDWLEHDSNKPAALPVEPSELPEVERTGNFSVREFLQTSNVSPGILYELEKMSASTAAMCQNFLLTRIELNEVSRAITSISDNAKNGNPELKADLIRVRDFNGGLEELVTIYRRMLDNLNNWKWPPRVEEAIEHHLNGRQRRVLKPDTVNLVFVEILAIRWRDHFQSNLRRLRSSEWPQHSVYSDAIARSTTTDDLRAFYRLRGEGPDVPKTPIAELGKTSPTHLERVKQQNHLYLKGLDPASGGHIPDSSDSWEAISVSVKPAGNPSHPFRQINADIALCQQLGLGGYMSVLNAELNTFTETVPHDVLLEVMRFFGFDETWIKWLGKFLAPPVSPQARGDSDAYMPPLLDAGMASNLTFTTIMRECVLVILELAISFASDVTPLRYDELFWLWSQDVRKVDKAWGVMKDFAFKVGVAWDMEETGHTLVAFPGQRASTAKVDLPKKPTSWGLLYLEVNGEWKVNKSAVRELESQIAANIAAKDTLIGKINAWNRFQSFFMRTTACITPQTTREFVVHLQQELGDLEARLGIRALINDSKPSSLPEGVLWWPLNQGGFGAHSHLASLEVFRTGLSENFNVHQKHHHPSKPADAFTWQNWNERPRDIIDWAYPQRLDTSDEPGRMNRDSVLASISSLLEHERFYSSEVLTDVVWSVWGSSISDQALKTFVIDLKRYAEKLKTDRDRAEKKKGTLFGKLQNPLPNAYKDLSSEVQRKWQQSVPEKLSERTLIILYTLFSKDTADRLKESVRMKQLNAIQYQGLIRGVYGGEMNAKLGRKVILETDQVPLFATAEVSQYINSRYS